MISQDAIKPLAFGALLALCAIGFGFSLGGAFGMAEHSLKAHLEELANGAAEEVYAGDSEKKEAVVRKSWAYMKRAHLHGGAIGVAALSSIVLLMLLGNPGWIERLGSIAFGAGALLYSLFWLCAGLTAPSLGGTHEAKEALKFLAVPGAGLCMIGLCATLYSLVRKGFIEKA
jgi:hypothetical protein